MADVVFETDEIQVLFADHQSPYLLLTFADATIRADGSEFFASTVAERAQISTLGFVGFRPNWFPEDDMAQAMESLRPILNMYPERISYGYSMGGYAVIKYAKLLQTQTAVAMCPQFTIDPSEMPKEYQYYPTFFRPAKHTGMNITGDSAYGNIFAFYDSVYPIDIAHMARICDAIDIVSVKMPYTGHNAVRCFRNTGLILKLFDLCRANDHNGVDRFARECRRRSHVRILRVGSKLAPRRLSWAMQLIDRHGDALSDEDLVSLAVPTVHAATASGHIDWSLAIADKILQRRPDSAHAHVMMADAFLKAGDRPQARAWAHALMAHKPSAPVARELLIRLLQRVGDLPAARAEAEAALREYPNAGAIMQCMADIAQENRDFGAAVYWGEKAVAVEPEALFRKERLGQYLLQDGKLDSAEQRFQQVVNGDPDNSRAQRGLVEVWRRMGHIDKAISLQRKLVGQHPDDIGARMSLATLLLDSKDFAGAKQLVQDGLLCRPDHPGLTALLGDIAQMAGDPQAALAWARKAAALEPQALFRQERLGQMLVQAGQFAEAAKCFRNLLTAQPGHKGALRGLVDALRKQGNLTEAVAFQRMVVEGEPTDQAAGPLLVGLLLHKGDLDGAHDAAQAVLAQQPDHVEINSQLAEIAQRRGDLTTAASFARNAARLQPKAPHRQERLGHILLAMKNYTEAAEVFARMHIDDPNHSGALRGLVDAHHKLGNMGRAIALQRELVASQPANPAARDWLVALLMQAGYAETALAEVELGLSLHPDHAGLLHRRSELAQKFETPAAAVLWARRALGADPQSLFRAEWLGHVLARAGELEGARLQFLAVLAIEPQRAGTRRALADIHIRQHDFAAALTLQRQLVAEDPANAHLHASVVATLLRLDEVPSARVALDQAVAAVGDHPALNDWRRAVVRRESLDQTWLPVPSESDPDSGWMKLHTILVRKITAQKPRVLFLGDSITGHWYAEDRGRSAWDAWLAPLGAGNIGIAGDKTQAVLWRLNNGAVAGIAPEIVVLMIGTNNIHDTTPANVALGVIEVLNALGRELPDAAVLLLGLLPRGADPDDPVRARIVAVNAALRRYAEQHGTRFMDLGHLLLEADGSLSPAMAPDQLHFSQRGYQIMAPPIAEAIRDMLLVPASKSKADAVH